MTNQGPNPGSPQQPPFGQPNGPQNLPPVPPSAPQNGPGSFLPQAPAPSNPPAYPQSGQPQQPQTPPQPGQPYPQTPAGQQPGMPQPGQPYPQGPAGQQAGRPEHPVGPPHTPPSSFGFPPAGDAVAPAKKSRLGLIIGIAAGAVALILIAVIAIVVIRMNSVPPSQAAAKNYLEAVARGDAKAALGYAMAPTGDTALLTDQVLAESKKTAPLTEIKIAGEVPGNTNATSRIRVSYKLGSEQVQTIIPVEKSGDAWKVSKAGGELSFSLLTIPHTVNGVDSTATGTQLAFPGAYSIKAKSPYVSLNNGKCEASVESTSDFSLVSCTSTVTPEGQTAFRTQAQAVLNACARSTSLNLTACGVRVIWPSSLGKVKSVKWTVSGGASTISTAQFTVSSFAPKATAPIAVSFRPSITTTSGSKYKAVRDPMAHKITVKFNPDGTTAVVLEAY